MPASYLLSSDNCHAPRCPSTAANAKLAEANTKLQEVQNKVSCFAVTLMAQWTADEPVLPLLICGWRGLDLTPAILAGLQVSALNAQLAELESQYAVRACCAAAGWVGDRPAWQVLHPVNAQFNSRPGA